MVRRMIDLCLDALLLACVVGIGCGMAVGTETEQATAWLQEDGDAC